MASTHKRFIEGKGFLLGVDHNNNYIYMRDFSWDCGHYWAGGYLTNCYKNTRPSGHYHFDSTFLKGADSFDKYRDNLKWSTLNDKEIWRLLDLMKQFYTLKQSAEVFQYGGHYTSYGRTKEEIVPHMSEAINKHIESVIIPQIKDLLTKYTPKTEKQTERITKK